MQERSINAHTGAATCLAASPDGKLIASGGADGKVKFWNTLTGIAMDTLSSGRSTIRVLAWSHDGSMLACGGDERVIQVWKPNGQLAGTIVGHDDAVTGFAWSQDGRTLISAARDGILKLWRIADFSLASRQPTHDRAIAALARSPKGDKLVTAGTDGKLRLWTVSLIGLTEAVAVSSEGPTTALAWDRSGDFVICGQSDGSLRYRRSTDLSSLQRATAHIGAVTSIAVPPNVR
jgi:WD40 repeat protein